MIAAFFEKLADIDLVQQETWRKFSKAFESLAFEEVSKIRSDHMMFVLLNVALSNHEGKCLIQLAQEDRRVTFLNNERVSDVINHMYRVGYLKPEDQIQIKPMKFTEMFETLIFHFQTKSDKS